MIIINTLEQDKPIGDKIDDLLWDFMNDETHEFLTMFLNYASDLRKFDGHTDIFEEWCQNNGINTCTLHKDKKGVEFLFDPQTGKTMQVKNKLPRYLKVIKGNS